MNDDRTQEIVDAVAHATRSEVGRMSPARLDEGWERLERALGEGRYPKVPVVPTSRRLWWAIPTFALAAAALLVFGLPRLLPARPEAPVPLHYVVEGAGVGAGETIATAPGQPARLLFSDSSEVRVAPSTKMAVLGLDPHGSRIALSDGEMEVQVRHLPATSWRFEAGPFSVKVVGTAFHLAFDARRGRLKLEMRSGAVEVRGPTPDRLMTLRAGESIELFAQPGRALAPSLPTNDLVAMPTKPTATQHDSASPEERPPARVAPAARHRTPRAEAPEPGPVPVSWPQLIAHGDFAAVVEDAESRGIDATLAGASAADLNALADAARYVRRNDLARRALLGLRSRFPGTARAGDAAFFLGRLAESSPSSTQAAVRWYETYLGESQRGPFAGEAMGREMSILARTDRGRARALAAVYLERFPHGSEVGLARSLVAAP